MGIREIDLINCLKMNKPLKSIRNCVSLLLFITITSQTIAQSQPHKDEFVKEGIRVNFSMLHIDKKKQQGVFTEGDDVKFRFEITDTVTNNGVLGARPAAWMNLAKGENNEENCGKRVASLVGGDLFNKAELDLNTYYVLTLNDDNTISVVDPLFSFGGSQLLAYIQLNGIGYDWQITENQEFVFVSVPTQSEIAVIRTSDWSLVKNITIPGKPKHIRLQKDNHYLWVAYETMGKFEAPSGVAVINTATLQVQQTIETGQGQHQVLTDDKNRNVFVTNSADGSLSTIDVNSLKVIQTQAIGGYPAEMDYSPLADAVYVLDSKNHKVVAFDAANSEKIKNIPLEAGCNRLKISPTGRLGVILNPLNNTAHILDITTNKMVQTADVEEHPDEIAFTDQLAYIKHRGSEIVWMIPLDVLGYEGKPVPLIDFPAGQNPPSEGVTDCGAPSICETNSTTAVLVSNYKDKSVYFYAEGMAAPMGQFNNYGKFPRAVMIVDRSIHETEPGVYEAVAKLRTPGDYNVSFFMDPPTLIHCFPVTVKESEEKNLKRVKDYFGELKIKYLPLSNYPEAGKDIKLQFQLIDIETEKPVTQLDDVQLLNMSTSGQTHNRFFAKESNAPGTYEVDVNFQQEGLYYIYIACESRGLPFSNPQYKILQVAKSKSN